MSERTLRLSISNDDLPNGAIGQWTERLRTVMRWAAEALATPAPLSGGFATPQAQQCRSAIANELTNLSGLTHHQIERITRAVLTYLREALAAEALSAASSRLPDAAGAHWMPSWTVGPRRPTL